MVVLRVMLFCYLLLFFSLFESTFQQLERLTSQYEFLTLLELRSSLGLMSKDWPIKSDPCLIWNGISCLNGRVVGINISRFKRTRIGRRNPQFAVDSLANLTLLQSFNASHFPLPGPIPSWFGVRLNSLQVLDLRYCSVIGNIPLNFGNLTNLTGLYLSDNNLTGTIPSTFGQLLRLSVLDLSRNLLIGSIPLSFSSLANLSLLDISSNNLTGSISTSIGSLLKLQYLNISHNMLSSSIPAQIRNLDSLMDLVLSFNSLSGSVPQDLIRLENLTRLEIQNNLLSGSLPDDLWSMPRLLFLDISRNNFSGMLPNSSFNQSPTTTPLLNISHNMFYGGLISSVLRRFGVIDLSGNYFEGKVPDYLLTNTSLRSNCLQNISNQRTLSDCSSFYTEKGLIFDNFGLPNSSQSPPPVTPKEKKKSNKTVIILASVFGGIGLVSLLLLLIFLLLFRRKRESPNQRGITVDPASAVGKEPPPLPGNSINFSRLGDSIKYHEILQSTNGFSEENLIKHGHSGDLFRGVLENGIPVVIKRVDPGLVKNEAYLVELDFFSKISHTRLVPLLGNCLENEDGKFLVYKYMPNGDLSGSLYRKTDSEDDNLQSLDWITRLKIALGAAEGLSFLHHECTPPLVHRDVQASSILLDDKFEVRLGSLSGVSAQEGDTYQSRITRLLRLPQSSEHGSSGSLTTVCSYDVYCFGKVLLGLVTGELGISASDDAQTKSFLNETLPYISIYDKVLVTKIVDPSLIIDEDLLEEVWAMAVVAKSCLNPKPSRRPLMRYVLSALENPLRVVREENSSSARLRATSSRGSWNAALFGSWRHSLSDLTVVPAVGSTARAGGGSFKQSGTTTGSQGSGNDNNNNNNNNNGGGEHSSSRRWHSKEIFPEPSDELEVERPEHD